MNIRRRTAKQTVTRYRDFFETVCPETLEAVAPLVADDIRFVDPFNDVCGRTAFIAIFEKMYDDVQDPKFVMLEEAWADQVCFLKWRMTCRQRHLGDWAVEGVTELQFDGFGRVQLHRDYWDAGAEFYGKLPVLRQMIGFVRRRIAAN